MLKITLVRSQSYSCNFYNENVYKLFIYFIQSKYLFQKYAAIINEVTLSKLLIFRWYIMHTLKKCGHF